MIRIILAALALVVSCEPTTSQQARHEELTQRPAAIPPPPKYPPYHAAPYGIALYKQPDGADATDPALLKQLPFERVPTVKLMFEPGGNIHAHLRRFSLIRESNAKVEVLDTCASACTLVLAVIAKANLCIGPNAMLKFHQAQNPDLSFNFEATARMYDDYPADIRKWIDSQGGIPRNGRWLYLDPMDLWKMGYAKCVAAR